MAGLGGSPGELAHQMAGLGAFLVSWLTKFGELAHQMACGELAHQVASW